MTDNEIMEALGYCTNPKVQKKCPRAKFVDVCNDGCIHLLMKQALDLINRQKAEIEKLEEMLESKSGKNEANETVAYLADRVEELCDEIERKDKMINALIAGQESLTNYINVLLEEKGGAE